MRRVIVSRILAVWGVFSALLGSLAFGALRFMNPDMTVPRLWLTYPFECTLFALIATGGAFCFIIALKTWE